MLFQKKKTKSRRKRSKGGAADARARRLTWWTVGMVAVALVALGGLNWARTPEGRASLQRLGVDRYEPEILVDLDDVISARFPDYAPAAADSGDVLRRHVLEAPAGLTLWEVQAELQAGLDAMGGRILWGERLQRPRRRYAESEVQSREILRLDLGVTAPPTHLLLIHPHGTDAPVVRWGDDEKTVKASDLLGDLDTPTVAIIVDDWGNGDTASTRAMLKVDVPLTLSILPDLRYSRRYALAATELALPDDGDRGGKISDETMARRWRLERGCREDVALGPERTAKPPRRRREVMLHLPMEPQGYPEMNPGRNPILTGMPRDEIAAIIDDALAGLPGVTGVNNHMGSAATSDRVTMDRVAEVLAGRGLFFIDSMTSSRSVAAEATRAAGIPTLTNRMFLDQAESSQADVERLLKRLIAAARKSGSAVAICHPYPETMIVLRRELPRLRSEGIRFVTISELLALNQERSDAAQDRTLAGGSAARGESAP